MLRVNPCLFCGACCAFFRVSFYWREADEEMDGTVPVDLTEDIDQFYRCMKGTDRKPVRCTALSGEVGKSVRCSIYNCRSSTCRDFGIHFHNGLLHTTPAELERCNRARAAWNLPPLFQPAFHHVYAGLPGFYIHPFHISRRRKRKNGGGFKPDGNINSNIGQKLI